MRMPSTLLLISAATAFTSVPYCARSFSTGPLNACEICPVIIAGSTGDCLGAAMALCAKDELLNSREDRSRPSVPPSQMIAFFNELSDDQQQQQRSHSIIDTKCNLLFLDESTDDTEQLLSHALQLMSRINPSL